MTKVFVNAINTLLTISIILLAIYLMASPIIPEVQLYLSDVVTDESEENPTAFKSKYVDPALVEKDLVDDDNQDKTEISDGTQIPENILNPTSVPLGSLPTPTDTPSLLSRIVQPFTGPESNPVPDTGAQTPTTSSVPLRNVLLIPKINVDGLIYEGDDPVVLNYGIWHRPKTSTPDKGGNTVFVAHRYLYTTGINTFYHLPKMANGDQFVVFWQGKEYVYEVFTVETVLPTATEIEENTEEPIVTLYTCTPLWTSEYRLVVKGKLVETPT